MDVWVIETTRFIVKNYVRRIDTVLSRTSEKSKLIELS